MFEIKEVTDKKEWEEFLTSEKPHTFLQSWNWGEFHRLMDDKFWRLGIYEKNSLLITQGSRLIGVALVIKISAKRGTFLFVPHGPILRTSDVPNIDGKIRTSDVQKLEGFVDYLKNLARQENCSFIRISPILPLTPLNEKLFKDLGFRRAPIHMHAAELVWILDVSQNEEQILKGMRKTTRYLVRKAEGEPIDIIKSDKLEDLEKFNKVYEETVKRQHFIPYSRKFLERAFEAFQKDKQVLFFFAEYEKEIVSAAMIIFYGESAFYHQGASLGKYPKIPAPYLLQWEIIREAKKKGLRYYNFWGISPENEPRHPWAGLSLFKKGFGGFTEEYVPAQDLILKKSYWLTYLIEKTRKIKRGL